MTGTTDISRPWFGSANTSAERGGLCRGGAGGCRCDQRLSLVSHRRVEHPAFSAFRNRDFVTLNIPRRLNEPGIVRAHYLQGAYDTGLVESSGNIEGHEVTITKCRKCGM